MGDIFVPASGGRMVRVTDVAHLTIGNAPASIDRFNRMRQISVNANLDTLKITLGTAVAEARTKVGELGLKAGYQVTFGGSARTLSQAGNDFAIAIILAVAFIYMVLASQFNSFIHPLTIMTALPLSLPAGLLALMAFGMTINVYSAIGLMMLFGIVKKNSILQVDYTNTLRAEGLDRHKAIVQANHVRLRPILMTTIAIVAGMLPIAFGRGAGSGSRASMAVTIIGGQILCLLLTLLITPVVYSYFDGLGAWRPSDLLTPLRKLIRPGAPTRGSPRRRRRKRKRRSRSLRRTDAAAPDISRQAASVSHLPRSGHHRQHDSPLFPPSLPHTAICPGSRALGTGRAHGPAWNRSASGSSAPTAKPRRGHSCRWWPYWSCLGSAP